MIRAAANAHNSSQRLYQEIQAVQTLLRRRQRIAAIDRARSMVQHYALDPIALFVGAQVALRCEALADAKAWLGELCKRKPPSWQAGMEIANMLLACNMASNAHDYLVDLQRQHPGQPVLLAKLGGLTASFSDFERARNYYRAALQLDPTLTAPFLFLARDRQSDPRALLTQLPNPDTTDLRPAQVAVVKIAEGICHERLGQHRVAFRAYRQANELTYRPQSEHNLERRIVAAPGYVREFKSRQLHAARAHGHPSTAPVFIVGMPRSGTTLVEQILGAHPQIETVGERRIIGNLVHGRIGQTKPETPLLQAIVGDQGELIQLGEQYLERVQELVGTARRIVDKMPFNFALVGACHVIFPRARIIHLVRDPLDVCWSMYTAAFNLPSLQLSLSGIGKLYALQEYLMAHWHRRCGQAIVRVRYESLVDDFENQCRRLVASIGLDWSDQCLQFQRRKTQVHTASQQQVRQGLFRSSLGRSIPFHAWLGDFTRARTETSHRLHAHAEKPPTDL